MRLPLAIVIGFSGLLTACFESNQEINGPEGSVSQKSDLPIAARTDKGSTYFSNYTEVQTNGLNATERFADCGPDHVMTGVGGWVSSGDFRGVTVYCKAIMPDGSLGGQVEITSGTPGIESKVFADYNKVVVGVGGWVRDSNLNRALIRQCTWDASTRSIDVSTCTWKGSDGNTSGELTYDVHSGLNATEWPKTIATGAGFTASSDNVAEIRLTVATLK